MIFKKIAILGAGMIGASIMQAAKQRQVAESCVAWSRSKATRELAAQADFCDAVYPSPQEAVAGADCIIACVPVDRIIPLLFECVPAIQNTALVTDVGSTKAKICSDAKTVLPQHLRFIGSHPMAGSELNGFSAGNAELLQQRLCFVENLPYAKQAIALWEGLGMRTRLVDPEEHDAIVAHVSHLPHSIAVNLSATLAQKPISWRDCGAGGLRDTSRVSAGDPHIWRAILEENRQEILPALSAFEKTFSKFKTALENQDSETLLAILQSASEWRLPLSKQ